jgi:hypothetical protein
MYDNSKTRLSFNFIILKIICTVAIIVMAFLLFISESFNSQKELEGWFLLILYIFFLLYCLFMPKISYDETWLYIKRFMSKERLIPLTNITLIEEKRGTMSWSLTTYCIEYLDHDRQIARIRFRAKYQSNSLNSFFYKIRSLKRQTTITII